uniref:carcinoembryonic antigen-related cell adhesion molecule 1 n=1 Tax=Semicossyphus pulcher TaxID=241346 RepID=UPI0037E7D136
MECPVVFVLILAMITFATTPAYSQSIEPSENPIPVGSTVTFSSTFNVTTVGSWSFENDAIVFIINGVPLISDKWKSRVTFNSSTSSLTISSLQLQDSGKFTLQEFNSFSAEVTLSVQVPISGVTLQANATDLVEFNDTAVLMCSVANGTSLSYVWMKGNTEVTAGGGVQFSDDHATLTIVGVTRNYNGLFKCNVTNGISGEVSLPVHLNISYGPSNTKMMIMPAGYTHKTGSNITVSCSAESSPAAMIQWMVDGKYRNDFGPKLQVQMATVNDSGNYKCIFHNTVTYRFSSASAEIGFFEPLKEVTVNHTSGPAILDGTLTLHCEVAESANMIQWWRNGELITADNSTVFDMSNKTLTINPVQLSDKGKYQCKAFNPVSHATSSAYTVDVYYGPMKPVITGPSMALTGTQVILNCSSASNPPSHISWYSSNSLPTTGSKLMIGPLTLNMSGKYICKAFNNITDKNSTAYTTLTVLAPVTMASIKIVGAQPILNHTFILTCETAGSVDSIIWMHGWSQVLANDTKTLSVDNSTLTFDPVMDSDNGDYRCVASNPLSNFTSEAFMLDVFYGPKKPTIMGPKGGIPGEKVTFSCHASSNPPSSYQWFFNGSPVANTSEYVTPPLTSNMSGIYTCKAFNNITGKYSMMQTMLTVIDKITDIQVEPQMNPAIEGHVYMLTCNLTGPAEHVYWMKNGHPLHEDNRTAFSMDNKTVTFNPIHYNDSGKYQCMAFNAVWNKTSPAFMLQVYFGPKTPMITGPAYAETGHKAVFICSAKSMPPSQYTWLFNSEKVANTATFTTSVLTLNMSGEYTCKAYNNVTEKNSTNSKMLTVVEAIESVSIRNNTVPIDSINFTLTCEVTGPYDTISWKKGNMNLNQGADKAMSYHIEDNKLHFTPLTTQDVGEYQCVATNKARSHHSPKYMLLVNYGPLSVTITGPDSIKVGLPVAMLCSADSHPDCEFQWFFNRLSSPLTAGSLLTFPVTNESSGTYICEARNPVTNITKYGTKEFTAHAAGLHTQSKGALMMMGLFAVSVNVLFN